MKILYITPLIPYPLDGGGPIKTYQTIKSLSEKNDIYLVCFTDKRYNLVYKKSLSFLKRVDIIVSFKATASFRNLRKEIFKSFFSPLPFMVIRYHSRRMKALVRRLIQQEKFDIIHIDHLFMSQYLPEKKESLWVLEEHNIESHLNWQIFKKEPWNSFKVFSFWEALKMRLYEMRVISKFDYFLAISDEDKKRLVRLGAKKEKAYVLPLVSQTKKRFRFKRNKNTILFVATLNWWPNKEAIFWFVGKVFPLIISEIPDAEFIIVGKNASFKMIKLIKSQAGVNLVGYVKNIDAYLTKASCFVIPVLSGSGIRVKLLTAMAVGLPVVSTSIGAEGIPVKNNRNILVANTAEDFAKAVVRVLQDQFYAQRLSKNAISFIKKNCSLKKAEKVLNRIYGGKDFRVNLS